MAKNPSISRLLCVWGLSVCVAAGASARAEADDSLERLRGHTEAHPDDPDLAWAYAQALAKRAQLGSAVTVLRDFVSRWPERKPQAWLRLGELLYSMAEYEEALHALEEGLYRAPRSPNARLFRGLTLRALGRWQEAERELRVAARLDPSLEPETLLVRGIERMQQGDRASAEALLEQAIELDPDGDTSERARFALGRTRPSKPSGSRFSLNAFTGYEYDRNVTLESGTGSSSTTDTSDSAMVWGSGFRWKVLQGERTSWTVGFSYRESIHENLKEFDLKTYSGYTSIDWRPADRMRLRLDAFASDNHLDDDRYSRGWGARPNLFLTLGKRAGLARGYVEYRRTRYHAAPTAAALERGGDAWAAGLEHYVNLPISAGAWGALGVRGSRTQSHASGNTVGFTGDFDNNAGVAFAQLNVPLPWKFEFGVRGSYTETRYHNHNLVQFLNDSTLQRRRDRTQRVHLSLSRPLTDRVTLEGTWTATDQGSNVSTYNYTRQVMGLYMRTEFP